MEGCNKKPRTAERDGVLVAKLVKLWRLSGPPTEFISFASAWHSGEDAA